MNLPAVTKLLLLPCFAWLGACAPSAPLGASHPADQWAADAESGVVWQVGHHTPINYVVLPQMLSARTPQHARMVLGGHDLTLRARFSLLVEPVARGPESLYLGCAAGPTLEYWFAGKQACAYAGAGGGCGVIDSTGVAGGQGQDFTLNWYATSGLRYYPKDNLAISAGVFFQHLSNGGATDPNPGLDGLGPVIGVTGHF